MLGHWYSLLLLGSPIEPPVTSISAHGVETKPAKRPVRGRFEVDSFSGFSEMQIRRSDDDEVLLLLMV